MLDNAPNINISNLKNYITVIIYIYLKGSEKNGADPSGVPHLVKWALPATVAARVQALTNDLAYTSKSNILNPEPVLQNIRDCNASVFVQASKSV
jgi:hypothetical protein